MTLEVRMHNRYKLLAVAVIAVSLTMLVGCPSAVNTARDSAAALKGAIVTAQTQHQTECKADPTKQACVTINRAIDGQNALITAIQTYCGWSATVPPSDPTTKCVPVASALAGLQAATTNANTLITEVKAVIQ